MEKCTIDTITDVLEDVANKLRKLSYDDNELDSIIKKLENTAKNLGKAEE
ncbi:hypothetical protein [Tepidibacter hydrothermalis]|uniref:Uncharacterized protein n=1 Tax=Tepidibacter hydrothermalis TaxID=3036126 RepID=A0ABY8ED37_9FIRM|nr:hypothetical protein [Tepidibacter hydrothermalis]WFD08668.1 hypothetical protein P4S50_09665 [Tepidibacter hydrothermalis]